MKSTLFIIAFVLVGLFISSCQQQQQPGDNMAFIGGSEGLSMAFAGGAPPPEIYDAGNFPFSVNVIVENVGEWDVEPDKAFVRIVGIDPAMYKATDNDLNVYLDQQLRGAAKLVDGSQVPGDLSTFIFPKNQNPGAFMYLATTAGTDEITFQAELCYLYRSRSTTQICIKDQTLDSLNNDKICTVNEAKTPQNAGSPIHVSELREIPQGKNNVQVTFKIEHVGTGLFFYKDDINKPWQKACDDSLTNPDQNAVYVDVSFQKIPGQTTSTQPEIICPVFGSAKSSGKIILFQGQPREISCTIKGDNNKHRIYQALLQIDIDYTYLNYIQTPLIIRHVTT